MLFAVIFFALCALILLVSYGAYFITFHSPQGDQNNIFNLPKGKAYLPQREEMRDMIRHAASIPYEEVRTTSYDGLTLAGQYYHVADDAPLAICFHGYRATATRDFCGGMPLMRELGFNVLLPHHRSQGKSQGPAVTCGIKERFDVLTWVDYASRRFGNTTPILLYGISMGGATVLMAAGLELPENVKGILADCPYTTPEAIIKKVAKDLGIPPAIIYPFVRLGGLLFAGGVDPKDASALTGVEGCEIPITIIHGEADAFVPADMSRELKKANPAIDLQLFPGGHHGISYMKDKPRYLSIATEFALKCLKNK
ncbi:MAG: alpha/beta fold hydrolase [Oscillospiraceae bacterium]|nr:alpha/beta fold hydrolase [Oscillospiraceae bacterium]